MTLDDPTKRAGRVVRLTPRRILIYTVGSLGDTLLTIPAFHALRAAYPGARLVLLSNRQAGTRNVLAQDLVVPIGLCDEALTYVVRKGPFGPVLNGATKLCLLIRLRLSGFDAVAYLVERFQGDPRLVRDRRFFRLAGIPRLLGMDGLEPPPRARGLEIRRTQHRVDEILHRLFASGVDVPSRGRGRIEFEPTDSDASEFRAWKSSLHAHSKRPWIAIGPGSKMRSKIWPVGNFDELVRRLLANFDVWPVVFGGVEDQKVGEQLVSSWAGAAWQLEG